ncbi:hypothetical protein HAX54_048848 [Datura stramonium]|uniref:RRM domain-containing protein n=1 Tax=Datura stramonium TaxID=4076 RepID=A0ABS8SW47_DATST|nr:hypothetical protein [Datura stramonium]
MKGGPLYGRGWFSGEGKRYRDEKKPHFPKCSGSSVEQHNDANSTTIIFLKDDDSPPCLGIIFQNLIDEGLAKSTPEGRLKVVFSQFGDVSRVKIITDKKSKKSLGFAYIWFPDNESAQSAVREMNGKVYTGSDGKAWILQAECQVSTLQILGNSDLLLANISSLCNVTKGYSGTDESTIQE